MPNARTQKQKTQKKYEKINQFHIKIIFNKTNNKTQLYNLTQNPHTSQRTNKRIRKATEIQKNIHTFKQRTPHKSNTHTKNTNKNYNTKIKKYTKK